MPLYSVNTAGASRLLGSLGWSLPWGLGRAEQLAPGHDADTWPLAVEMKGHVGRTAGVCGVVTWGSKGACSPRLLSSKALDRDCQRTAPSLSPTRPLRSPVYMMPCTDGYRKVSSTHAAQKMPTTRPERQESHGQASFRMAHSEEQNWAHWEAMSPWADKITAIVWAGQIKGDPSSPKAAKGGYLANSRWVGDPTQD